MKRLLAIMALAVTSLAFAQCGPGGCCQPYNINTHLDYYPAEFEGRCYAGRAPGYNEVYAYTGDRDVNSKQFGAAYQSLPGEGQTYVPLVYRESLPRLSENGFQQMNEQNYSQAEPGLLQKEAFGAQHNFNSANQLKLGALDNPKKNEDRKRFANSKVNDKDDKDDKDDEDEDDDDDDGSDEIKDARLAKQIRDKLASNGLQLVLVDVRHGIVNLSGSVESGDKKARVDRGLKEISGIRNVNNNLEVKKPSNSAANLEAFLERSEKKYAKDTAATKEDRILNAKIRDKISGSWLASLNETLVIKTKNGFVVITGTVNSQDDIQTLGQHIASVDGLKSVDNQVKVKPR